MADGLQPAGLGLRDRYGRQVSYLRLSVTDRCGMAVLLGRMPWNRVKRATLASDDAVTASSH